MSCNLSIMQSSVTELLRKEVGTNNVLFSTYYTSVVNNEDFTPEFKQWCKDKYNTTIDFNSKNNDKKVVDYIKEYYNEKHPNINYSSRIQNDSTLVGRFGYGSVEDREFCKHTAANYALDIHKQILNDKHLTIEDMLKQMKEKTGKDISKKAYVASAIFAKVKKEIISRLNTQHGVNQANILNAFKTNNTEQIEQWFGNDLTVQDKNLLALYKEIIGNREEFFNEVFRDSRLGELRFEKDDNLDSDITEANLENQDEESSDDSSEEESNNSQIEDKDNYINNLNNKDGQYNNFMTHIDIGVKTYLNSLKKIIDYDSTTGIYILDTNNSLGVPDTMNAEEVSSLIYGYADYTNLDTFIKSLHSLADDIPGFTSLHQMADYLKTNRDFGYECYRTFAKAVISKMETINDNEKSKCRISNRSADKLTTLRFEYLNSSKATSIIIDDLNSRAIFDNLNKLITKYKGIYDAAQAIEGDDPMDVADRLAIIDEADKQLPTIIAELAKQLRRYYPTIEDTTIANYINNAHNGDKVNNLITLNGIIKDTINASVETNNNYRDRQSQIYKIIKHNQALDERKFNGERVNNDDYKSLSEVYLKEYVSKGTQAAAFNLANELVKYTHVKVDLNSRNVHGNLSSDVLNNSMITNILNTLKSDIALGNYGKYKSQSRQYDFSNIMIEHKAADGTIINYGLFTKDEVSQEFIPTPYAKRLLKARLFNGATDAISNKNVLYSEMSKGDYTTTAFINYFNTEDDYTTDNEGNDITFANYFMRIPSDAPKNFIITAPKYSIKERKINGNDGLFIIDNPIEANKKLYQKINSIPTLGIEYEALENQAYKRSLAQIKSDIVSEHISDITIKPKNINESNAKLGDTVTVTFEYKDENDISTQYVLQGVYAKKGTKIILSNPKFIGFTGNTRSSEIVRFLENHYRQELIKNGEIKRIINTNHPIYQQFRNIIIQELTDAATALDVIFKTNDGKVVTDIETKELVFNDGFADDAATIRKLYANYHVGKSKKLIENGKLTGAVFHSDRFKITQSDEKGNVKVRNYGQEIFDEAFDFLYGGANGKYIHTTRKAKGIEVNLTEEQEAKVTEKLSEFINDYIADTNNRITEYSELLPENINNEDNIAEFALNYYLTYVSFNDIFEGDTKYYKDSQTFLKRAKEVQGSGVPYGLIDYNMNLSAPRTQVLSRLNEEKFVRKFADGHTEALEVGQYNKFRGVTIKNSIRTGKTIGKFKKDKKGNIIKDENGIPQFEEVGSLTKKLIESLKEKGLTPKQAEDKAAIMMAGYDSTTVNDAQSYITFEEWIRRISARGQLQKYLPLIQDVLDETKPLDAVTIGKFIQVQKNFYYDQYFNEELKTFTPRQIKNAEFVLVPRLIKGTQLEQVYNLMKENGIDQLNTEETSKAGKCNVLTIWNNDGEITQENIDDFNNNAAESIELYNYNYLYTQQETPQHVAAENKAGIQIMKKILDNIPPTSKLYATKEHFFKLYSTNIKESFTELLDELDLQTDENGNLKLDENGNIEGLNYQLFFDKLEEEVSRLGLDSNSVDYVTLDNTQMFDEFHTLSTPITEMPTFMSNFSTKLESIAQSVFNSRITRQKLPGFHAAQITNIGWNASNQTLTYTLNENGKGRNLKDNLSKEEYDKLPIKNKIYYNKTKGAISASKELRYHPNGEHYIEILLPKSNFNLKYKKEDGSLKTDEELLKELQDAKLDEMIGYRIPTEGKQSICIMKVVGFIDDALGSTIVVPDDWVSQTGSDFDIDSVYGINYTSRINKVTGKIERIPYKTNTTEHDYFDFLRRKLKHIPTKVGKDIEALKTEIQEERSEQYTNLMTDESEAYHSLPDEIRNEIKELQNIESKSESKLENYTKQNQQVIDGLTDYIKNNENLDEDLKSQIQDYISIRTAINNFINNSTKEDQKRFSEGKLDILKERLNNVEAKAKKAGLPTYEQFKNMSEESRNSRNARNNEILQSMIEILKNSESLEENLSRSNFEDIIDARNKSIDPNVAARRKARSPYNFFDQAEYQEDVMSGAKLKAFSVTRDTFCSICNTVRPLLNSKQQVKIIYNEKDGYNLDNLKKSFDNIEVIGDKKGERQFIVTHDTFGWSKDNKNAAGKILTSYSSQTTAHILDAVKEGSIPNVNDFTFQVYKTFPDLGSDYETGVSFIMQPGVTRIVKAYNSSKSIYSNNYNKPINEAIKSIAKDLLALEGVELNTRDSIDNIIKQLQKYNSEIANLFNANGKNFKIDLTDKECGKLLINSDTLKHRLQETDEFSGSSPVEERRKLLYDLGVILQYNKISNLANSVSAYARVCNPDKFGAKQTIYATNKVFDDIQDLIDEEQPALLVKDKDGNIKSFLKAIYPDVDKDLEGYIESTNNDSAYLPLHSFLKYATATSIKINRNLFETQQPAFRKEIMKLKRLLSGSKPNMTEKLYKDFQNYVLSYLYNQTDAISKTITYVRGEGFKAYKDTNVDAERSRIFGYGKNPDLNVIDEKGDYINFDVNDINNPNEKEIEQFITLSPAQKVLWIQSHFDGGIFQYLHATLFSDRQYRKNKAGMQTLEFVENNTNIETIYNEFEKCFYNDNPLIALTALDIVKYGFVVEGFKMKRNGISKVIKNSCLIDDTSYGTGIVTQLMSLIGSISNKEINMEQLRNNFIRSHSSINQIETHKVERDNKKRFELNKRQYGIIYLDGSNTTDKDLIKKYGFGYETDNKGNIETNKFVKLRFGKNIELYKIETIGTEVFAYPVSLLEENETSEWSVNAQNNYGKYDNDFYQSIKEEWFNTTDSNIELKQIIENHKEEADKHKYVNPNKPISSHYAATFDINTKRSVDTGGFEDVIEKVTKYFNENPKGILYLRSGALAKYIKYTGLINGSIQVINGREYRITKEDFSKYNRRYIGSKNLNHEIKEKNEQIVDIIEKARDAGYKVNDAFRIEPVKNLEEDIDTIIPNETMNSSVTELGTNSVRVMSRNARSNNDVQAYNAINSLKDKGINSNKENVENNITEVINTTAEYIQNATTNILDGLNNFMQDDEGKYHPVNDKITIDYIRNNPAERKRFLKTLLDARAFVRNYRMINDLDIDAEDESIRSSLTIIKNAISKLQNATAINKAEELFANEYLAKLSNNPMVQNDYLSLLDGYHSAGAFDAWVNDLQETSNPLLQIITKEVMQSIRGAEMKATKQIREFKNRLNELKETAQKAGVSVDWKHIIDDNGKFIQDYNKAFTDKIEELREKRDEAKLQYGEGSIQHLEAKFEYDKFKLNHVYQQLEDDYYQKKLMYQKAMLDNFPSIYSEYHKLLAKRNNILSHSVNGKLDEAYEEQFKEVKREIDNLTNTYYYNSSTGEFEEKYSVNDPNNNLKGDAKKIYSIEAANALQNYLTNMRKLREQYYTKDAKFGFDKELEKNLDIIAKAEERDDFGRPTRSIDELMKRDDYVKAKDWIDHNARYVVGEETTKLLNNAFKVLREKKQGRNRLSSIAKTRDAYDNQGNIDATKFTDEDIEKLFEEELTNYNIREGEPYSDRSLISNAPKDGDVFYQKFYSNMKSNGLDNPTYLKLVKDINNILSSYYETATGILHTEEITEEDLKRLIPLYDQIEETKKTIDSTNGKAIRKYITKNVDFIVNNEIYKEQKGLAEQKGKRYLRLWQEVFERIGEDEKGNDIVIPNRRVFGYAVPKGYKPDGSGNNDLVDKDKSNALKIIRAYTTTIKTKYYYQKYHEMRAKGDKAFHEWYRKNHIYNPYDKTYQPLSCWTTMKVNPMADEGEHLEGGLWVPAFNQQELRPKNGKDKNGKEDGSENYINPNWKEKGSTASNYKASGRQLKDNSMLPFGNDGRLVDDLKDSTDYSNHDIPINKYEKDIRNLLQSTIEKLATTAGAKQFINSGYAPARNKGQEIDGKFLAKEVLKFIGWIEGASGRDAWYENIDYANDKTIDMPMMNMLKSKDSVTVNRTRPERKENESDEDYNKRLNQWKEDKKAAEEQNAKVHKELLDNNWESVMEDFINKAAHFNAIQENKYMLFYAKNMIDKLDVYVKNEGFNNLQKDNLNSTDEETKYVTRKDTRLQEQYVNWIRRLVYDQWKKPNANLTRTANILQSITSAKFMMFNVTGGIANVTVGETGILGEAFAKEYFGTKTWREGMGIWRSGISSYLADKYSDKSTSLANAIIKFMNVVDFDEVTGSVHIPNASTYIERARDLAFTPQTMGEHFMQNGAMFSMMLSHRLFVNHDKENNGKLSYELKNEAEYIRDANEKALQEVLTDKQKRLWKEFVKYETKDANNKKEYVWFRKDLTTQFEKIYLDNEQRTKFIAKRRELQNKAKKEFNDDTKHPTLYSQLKLGSDGKLDFKDDSILQSMGDEAFELLGGFKGRVISVNKKIHGVYDRLGAAKWESYWWGGIVMQYHKHLYPGIMKRYRRQGYFNEERGTIEKGCYASLKDFLSLPLQKRKFANKIKADNNMSDSELQAVQGVQNLFKEYVDFATHIKLNWNSLPEYERANIKRSLGDLLGVASALCIAIALRVVAGDDDDQGLVYNLMMYEADRLASESAMYNPLGLASEGQKLWSSPVAVQSGVEDLLHSAGFISQWIIQGDEFDPYYSSGLYAGENKLWVNIRRQIPIYHSINMIQRLERSNKYYKLGKNMLSIIPTGDIGDAIAGR